MGLVPSDDDLSGVSLVQLAEPRLLTAPERALLDALVDPLAIPELSAFAACARVTAECACGCPSIGLYSEDGPELSAEADAMLRRGRPPYEAIEITAYGVNERGDDVQVTLHVGSGRLVELEIWTGTFGGDVHTELPRPDTLRPQPPDSASA